MAENENVAQQNFQQELMQNMQRGAGLGMFLGPTGALTGAVLGLESSLAGNAFKNVSEQMQNSQQLDPSQYGQQPMQPGQPTMQGGRPPFPPPGQGGFGADGQQFDQGAMYFGAGSSFDVSMSRPSGMGPNMGQPQDLQLTDAQKEKFGEFIESLSTEQKVQLFTEMYQGGPQQQMRQQGIGNPDFSQSRSDGFKPWAKGVDVGDATKAAVGMSAIPVLGMMPGVVAAGMAGRGIADALSKQFGDGKSPDDVFADRVAENQRDNMTERAGVDMSTLDIQQGSNPGMQFA